MRKLTDEQVEKALKLFYIENKKLGEVAEAVGCRLYDLTSWLLKPGARKAAEALR